MLSTRVPLFSVSIAFATGCLLGLDQFFSVRWALILFATAGLAWLFLFRRENGSLISFYFLAACAGLAHTLLVLGTVSSTDLRRLPEEKSFASTQWQGRVIDAPATQASAHPSRRALDRTVCSISVENWRPTEGRLFAAAINEPWRPAFGIVRCTVLGPAGGIKAGDRLEFAAGLAAFAAPLSPGQLDYRAFESRQGIYYQTTLSPLNWRCIKTKKEGEDFALRARDWAYARLQLGLEDDPRMADFLAGMLIGYRQEIPADIQGDFRRTGTLHVFAVSGQNIAEMVLVVIVLLQLCGLVRWRWAWTLAPIILIYCLLTGAPPSAVRATLMVLSILLAWRLGRPLNALGGWSLALIAMLIWDPGLLFDPGAQLSFGVVLGLILISPPIYHRFRQFLSHDPLLPAVLLTKWQQREESFWSWAGALIAASIAATLVSEPITALDFHQVTPVSILANLVVVPMAGLITVVGTISIAASVLSPGLAALFNNANWAFAKALILFVGFLAHEPGAALNVPDLRALQSDIPSVVVSPVQDSACLLIRTATSAWLVNTGREAPSRAITAHLLQFYGINRLDGLVLAQVSGPDNSGALAIARDYRPRRVIVPSLSSRSPAAKLIPDIVSLSGGRLENWQRGAVLDLGSGVSLEVLNPDPQSPSSRGEDRALVFALHEQGRTLLWAGKIGPETRQEISDAYPQLRADILVLGSDSAPAAAWLQNLGVDYWLKMPPAERNLNVEAVTVETPDCAVWPLEQTGAVDIHLESKGVLLQPWNALPKSAP